MNERFVMVAFNGNHRDGGAFEFDQDLLGLAQVRWFDLGAIEKVAGNQKDISFLVDGLAGNLHESIGQILVGKPAIQAPPAQVNIRGVKKFHAGWL